MEVLRRIHLEALIFMDKFSPAQKRLLLRFRNILKKNEIVFSGKDVFLHTKEASINLGWLITNSDYNEYELSFRKQKPIIIQDEFRTSKDRIIKE